MTLYKWLTLDRVTTYRKERWPVRAQAWTPREIPLLCTSGWHLATLAGLSEHLPTAPYPAVLWTAEGRGATDEAPDKIAFAQARILSPVGTLTEAIAHGLACDFAERVLPIYEGSCPDDDRPRLAIATKRAWLRGAASDKELAQAAAGADASANAAAAQAHATSAAAAAAAAYVAPYGVYDAAYDAALTRLAPYTDYDAAAAAYAAHDYVAEREWQGRRILEVLGS